MRPAPDFGVNKIGEGKTQEGLIVHTEGDWVKIVVTDDMIAKWYTNNVQSLELPERYKLRYVKIPLSDSKLLAPRVTP